MNVIALVDCDSFFVSCEQKVNPALKNMPVCVLSNKDGCVISRSREAKQMGIKMGQPYFMARHEFPDAVYVSCHHDLYTEISDDIMNLLRDFSPYVQVYSVDEAFVDLTGLRRLYKGDYCEIAVFLRKQILEKLDIPVSIGISLTKSLAKLASDKAKNTKSGIFYIPETKIQPVLKETKIEEIWGIGKRLTLFFKQNGILTASELVEKDDKWLDSHIGINALEIKHELLGEMVSPVVNTDKIPKSVQKTGAFGIFTTDLNFIKNQLNYHIHNACRKLRQLDCKAKNITVMLRTKDYKVFYEKYILRCPTDFELEISEIALKLIKNIYSSKILYRSVGIILEDLHYNGTEQLFLFTENENSEKKERLTKCFDRLENKFGKNIIQIGYRQGEL